MLQIIIKKIFWTIKCFSPHVIIKVICFNFFGPFFNVFFLYFKQVKNTYFRNAFLFLWTDSPFKIYVFFKWYPFFYRFHNLLFWAAISVIGGSIAAIQVFVDFLLFNEIIGFHVWRKDALFLVNYLFFALLLLNSKFLISEQLLFFFFP